MPLPEEIRFKVLSIRDFTQSIARVLHEGGEVVVMKGKEPYRYMNIRPIRIKEGGITNGEYQERYQENQEKGIEKEISEEVISEKKI